MHVSGINSEGQRLRDREDLSALAKLYSHPIYIGSLKLIMGHAEYASCLMSTIKVILMSENQKLYPNFDFQKSPHEIWTPYILFDCNISQEKGLG